MIVKAKAPTRIDLAGGTIDMWPLFLFHNNAQTINVAIDLPATCSVQERSDSKIILESIDLKIEETYSSLPELQLNSPLQLTARIIKFFRPKTGVHIITDCAAPAGSGLGGSSALAVALTGALNHFTKSNYPKTQLLTIAQNIETQVIKVPSGVQDYYPAMYGGLNSINLQVQGISHKPITTNLHLLQNHLVLCYTGKPHFSGTNNWEIFKGYIDGQTFLKEIFGQICDIASEMNLALTKNDFNKVSNCLAQEWDVRKQLSPNISTEKIEQLISIAKNSGAQAAKVCGAGGGGCVVFFVNPNMKLSVIKQLIENEGQVLDVNLTNQGIQISDDV